MFIADQPIQNKKDDFLGRAGFAGHIGDAILKWNSEDSLCLGLYGEWGSGKTSIINMCVDHIKEKTKDLKSEDKPIIFRFNPWIISGQEAIVKSFLGHLRTILGKPDNAESARKAANLIGGLESFLGILSYIPSAGEVVKGAKEAIGSFRNTTLALSKQLDGDLLGLKETISDELRELNSPVIAIIDDIDRLSKEEIIGVFQLVKAVADFDNIVYFLAFDRKQVEICLEKIQEDYKYKYIDKIIQVGFDIPVPGHNKIKRYLIENLDELINSQSLDESEANRYNNLKFGPLPKLFSNIREVKKYLNYIRFIAPIIENEVSMTDFFIMGAIHQFAPEVYKIIIENQEVLVYDRLKRLIKPDYGKEKLEHILDICNRSGFKKLQNLLSILFPRIENINNPSAFDNEDNYFRNKRICLKEYFDHLLELTTPEDSVSSKEASDMIGMADNDEHEFLTEEMKDYMVNMHTNKLIARMIYDCPNKLHEKIIQNIIVSMIKAVEGLSKINSDSKTYPFKQDIYDAVDWLISHIPLEKRKPILLNAINMSEYSITLPISIANQLWREWNPRDREPISEKEGNERVLLTRSDTEEIKDLVLNRIREHSKSDYLVNNWALPNILYRWEQWADDDSEVKLWVSEKISNDKNIPNILRAFGEVKGIQNHKYNYNIKHLKIRIDELNKFFNLAKLYDRCEKLKDEAPEWMDEEDQKIIRKFLDEYDMEQSEEATSNTDNQIINVRNPIPN